MMMALAHGMLPMLGAPAAMGKEGAKAGRKSGVKKDGEEKKQRKSKAAKDVSVAGVLSKRRGVEK